MKKSHIETKRAGRCFLTGLILLIGLMLSAPGPSSAGSDWLKSGQNMLNKLGTSSPAASGAAKNLSTGEMVIPPKKRCVQK